MQWQCHGLDFLNSDLQVSLSLFQAFGDRSKGHHIQSERPEKETGKPGDQNSENRDRGTAKISSNTEKHSGKLRRLFHSEFCEK